MGYDPNNRGSSIIATSDRTSFYEKICLSVPACEKAWTFERVIGRQLLGFDNRVLSGIASRLRCQEICLKERQFVCRSGEYDYVSQECRLSSEDRRTQPTYFGVAASSVDYFENQCSPLPLVKEDGDNTSSGGGTAACGYKRRENLDLSRADLMRSAFSEDQCRSLCDATRAFVCRSFTYKALSSLCWLSSDDTHSSGGVDALISSSGAIYFERSDCLNIKLDCTPEEMRISLDTVEPFEGKIYAKDDPLSCETFGSNQRSTSLSLPLKTYAKCGVRKEIDGKYSTTVIIQHHPVIQRRGDRMIRLVCNFETPIKLITNSYRILPPTDILGSAVVNATAPTPNIKLRITDKDGRDIHGARLGEELYLRIDMENDSVFDLFARDLVARSGNNDEAITLIDGNGCPTDTAIFPSLERVAGSKSIQGKFDAFKFSDDEVVRFQVNVHFCLQKCAPPSCQGFGTDELSGPQESTSGSTPNFIASSTSPSPTPPPAPPALPLADPSDYRVKRRRRRGVNTSTNESSDGLSKSDNVDNNTKNGKNNNNNNNHNNYNEANGGSKIGPLSPLLPDYPLQREIIVEGLASSNLDSSSSSVNLTKRLYENSSIFCTSRTTLLAAFIATLILQTSLIAFCCSCLFFWRVRRPKTCVDKRLTNYGPYKGPYSSAWSSFSAIE
ncbi:uncharacterized protein LOC141853293 isoform X2 [Brevipalpus obovatus]